MRVDVSRVEVVAPNLKRRYSGVTSTVLRLVPLQAREIGIAARPLGVLVARIPGLPLRLDRFGIPPEIREGAGGVVEHGRFVRPQCHRQVRLADGILAALRQMSGRPVLR